ncbi:hypothetical protein AB0J80_04565 [Actinoplanes sp. NPDC049548]|uniref:hypothetical protein n=1 Tax=Actinoplanes sp. NPDC049548 TaxID=3155152 RepID=UPI00343C664A
MVVEPDDPTVIDRLTADFTADITRLRDSAERWRNGIAMITGILSAVLVFKGPDPVAGLATPLRVLLFAVVVLAIAAGMTGCFFAIRAAAGLPVVQQRRTTIDALATDQRARREATVRHLHRAIGLSAVMIALLVVSVGLAWFLPRPPAKAPMARMELVDGRVLCGPLVRLDADEVAITVFGEAVVVKRAQVNALSESQSCS